MLYCVSCVLDLLEFKQGVGALQVSPPGRHPLHDGLVSVPAVV